MERNQITNVTSMIPEGLTFDDVSLIPHYSEVLPHEVNPATRIGQHIELKIPFLSAAMDTVTESRTAIAMAQHGGMGVIHKNVTPEEQSAMVRRVKKYESHIVSDPYTLPPDALASEAFALMRKHGVSGFPVVGPNAKLIGVVTMRDLRLATSETRPIVELMTTELVTAPVHVSKTDALTLLHKHRIEKLLLTDDKGHLHGLITIRDLQKAEDFPNAARDAEGRLLCAAAVGPGADLEERVTRLLDARCDVFVVDTAHGHSAGVIRAVKYIRQTSPNATIIAGNIATAEAANALADAGADAVKVGIGPGSICTTRIVAGVGVPQVSAVMNVSAAARSRGLATIADGGIKFSGDCVKALAAGADVVMVGSVLAGTEEAPGEHVLLQGRSFKVYRGMGSLGAMGQGSADRYGQAGVKDEGKLVPEGVEGRVPFRGPLSKTLYQLAGGLRSGMGYLGAKDLSQLRANAQFVKVTSAGLRESHVHDVTVTKEAPNYWGNG